MIRKGIALTLIATMLMSTAVMANPFDEMDKELYGESKSDACDGGLQEEASVEYARLEELYEDNKLDADQQEALSEFYYGVNDDGSKYEKLKSQYNDTTDEEQGIANQKQNLQDTTAKKNAIDEMEKYNWDVYKPAATKLEEAQAKVNVAQAAYDASGTSQYKTDDVFYVSNNGDIANSPDKLGGNDKYKVTVTSDGFNMDKVSGNGNQLDKCLDVARNALNPIPDPALKKALDEAIAERDAAKTDKETKEGILNGKRDDIKTMEPLNSNPTQSDIDDLVKDIADKEKQLKDINTNNASLVEQARALLDDIRALIESAKDIQYVAPQVNEKIVEYNNIVNQLTYQSIADIIRSAQKQAPTYVADPTYINTVLVAYKDYAMTGADMEATNEYIVLLVLIGNYQQAWDLYTYMSNLVGVDALPKARFAIERYLEFISNFNFSDPFEVQMAQLVAFYAEFI